MFHVKPCGGQKVCRPLHRVKHKPLKGMTRTDIVGEMGGSLTLAAPAFDYECRTSGSRNENAPRTFASAKWRRLADARRRHKTHRRTDSVPTPYQGRVQGVGVHTRMFRNAINNQSIHQSKSFQSWQDKIMALSPGQKANLVA